MTPQEIKELRARLGMSQAALAKKIKVATNSVNRWENGRSNPGYISTKKLQNLAKRNKDE